MSEPTENREPIELLAEQFLEDRRRGRRVTVEDYAAAHPDQAEEIRDLFPTIVALESAKPDKQSIGPRDFDAPDRLGDLRILGEIGRGGMGVVYEAEQESLGRRVAVKVLPGRALFDTRQLERFRREARTAAALQHPSIVPIYSVGEQDGLHYLVMQRIDGVGLDVLTRHVGRRTRGDALAACSSVSLAADETLQASSPSSLEDGLAAAMATDDFDLARTTEVQTPSAASDEALTIAFSASGSLPSAVRAGSLGQSLLDDDNVDIDALDPAYYRSVAKIGAQAADALAYAHGRGALHRDIKPANLLLDRSGRVWVTDFGLAKMINQDDMSRTGELLGTLRYMAPEQLRGEATAKSDLYSLGLTLYELVTFRSPFQAPTPSQVLQKINEHRPERPRKLNPRVPVDLEKIILKAMAADPADRYADGAALAADLRRFLVDQPVAIAAASVTTQAQRWLAANRTAAIAAAVALLLGGAGVLGVLAMMGPPNDFREPGAAGDGANGTPPLEGQFEDGFGGRRGSGPRGPGPHGLGPPPDGRQPPRLGPNGEPLGPPPGGRGRLGPRDRFGPRDEVGPPLGDGPPPDFDNRPPGERFGPLSEQGVNRRDNFFEQRRLRQERRDALMDELAPARPPPSERESADSSPAEPQPSDPPQP
ncbi:Serine/threonine-protein kinase PrkC [Posidoniimonas polymericola]|uniref:Serine/threonine-protein kinase PrkC n=1 Tax=Posidoniimonas polymericola TaxID=2528002 RepID=A0A5C5ZEP8_9BACT|nr:serine/threonine-protein kinase [Posidoniimonas polymericola]TWT85527.1 Serine/threonine-protein kinase PrkC [Posidoniimonas polymericola]